MPKITGLFIIAMFFSTAGIAQSVLDIPFKKLNGDSVKLSQYAGKKILVVVTPISQDSIYQQIIAFKERYGDTVQVIGVPSVEDGFQPSQAAALTALFNNTSIVLTEGMKTRKSAGSEQSPLLQWLTDRLKNRHFNNDVAGIGHKFFITEDGRLFAVLGPQTSLQSFIINRIVHSNPQ